MGRTRSDRALPLGSGGALVPPGLALAAKRKALHWAPKPPPSAPSAERFRRERSRSGSGSSTPAAFRPWAPSARCASARKAEGRASRKLGLLAAALLVGFGCDDALDRIEAAAGPSGPSSRNGVTSLEDEGRSRRLYYQFVDDRGRVHFVQTLDAVPAAWRATMGYVELEVPPPLSPLDARRARNDLAGRVAKTKPHDELKVVLYSAEWCGACRKAKRHLERRGIRYELRDVDEPENLQALLERTGRKGIPVLDVAGRIVTGFSAKSYDDLLARG